MKLWKTAAAVAAIACSMTAIAASKPQRADLPYVDQFRELRGMNRVPSTAFPGSCRSGSCSSGGSRDHAAGPEQHSRRPPLLQGGWGAKALPAAIRLDPVASGEGALADRFGFALAWSGDTLLVGAIGDEVVRVGLPSGVTSGSVHVYRASGDAWTLEARLLPDPAFDDDRFGFSVAMSGELAVVGAPFARDANGVERGAVWIYARDGTAWAQVAHLTAADGNAEDRFGWSVASDGETVVVGAPRNAGSGAAYVFVRNGSRWMQRAKLAGAQAGAEMGHAVGVAGATVLVGAPRHETGGSAPDSGAVFRFDRNGAHWLARGAFGGGMTSVDARFGDSIAFAGTRAVIGASGDAVGALAARGSAFVFEIAMDATIERARLLAADGEANDAFGDAVAFDGASILVGAPGADGGEGAGVVFVESGSGFVEQARLSAADGARPEFAGDAVALRGDRALLGAALDDLLPNRAQGSVKSFARSGFAWAYTAQLDTGEGASHEQFGYAVALDGDTALVGAFLDDTLEAEDDAGTATVFRRDGAGWKREAILKAPDAESEDRFGISVALRGDRALVGAYWDIIEGRFNQGSAYVFRRDPGGWVFEAKLVAPDGGTNDYFGFALAFDGETAVVGAPGHDASAADAGAAYVFHRNGAVWTLQQKLAEAGWPASGFAGLAVALDGERLAIGVPTAQVGSAPAQGVVFVYARGSQAWAHEATVTREDGAAGDFFGGAVALADAVLVVGAPGDDVGELSAVGSACVFAQTGTGWMQTRCLLAPAPAAFDNFGYSVAASSSDVLIGAPGVDADAEDTGAAFWYQRGDGTWPLQRTLFAGDAHAFAYFGTAVARAAGQTLVGEPDRDRDNPQEGAAYVYADDEGLFADGFE